MKLQRTLVFLFFLLSGIIVGAMLASACSGISFLSWLAYGKTIGISTENPMLLDLSMLKVAFGFEVGINVAQIITITIALLVYKSVARKL